MSRLRAVGVTAAVGCGLVFGFESPAAANEVWVLAKAYPSGVVYAVGAGNSVNPYTGCYQIYAEATRSTHEAHVQLAYTGHNGWDTVLVDEPGGGGISDVVCINQNDAFIRVMATNAEPDIVSNVGVLHDY